jgi:MFS-type transporter involved in bile tolerance (Atg22 family)
MAEEITKVSAIVAAGLVGIISIANGAGRFLFGPKNVGSVYGLMLTAWSATGIVGPTLIARIRESTGAYRNALYVISVIMLVSAIIPFIVRPPLSQQEAAAEEAPPTPSPAPRERTT